MVVPLTTRPRFFDGWRREPPSEPIGLLLLPSKLEDFELRGHAQDLLDIDRVIALEPPRWQARGSVTSQAMAVRHARRLRLPGRPRAIVLYHPRQFVLARALSARYEAELWYVTGAALGQLPHRDRQELQLADERAREVAAGLIAADPAHDPRTDNRPLRDRLVELEVISSRPFVPGARIRAR